MVTGAAGFVAFHVIEALLRRQIAVFAVDNFDPFYPAEIKKQNIKDLERIAIECGTPFRFEEIDICDLDKRNVPSIPISAVIHLAARPGVQASIGDPIEWTRVNVLGTLSVLELCRRRKIESLIFSSSSSVYGDDTPSPFSEDAKADHPISPYAASKRAGEMACSTYCHLFGLKVIVLRFFTVYGPRQRPDMAFHKFGRLMLKGDPIPVYDAGPGGGRDYTYASDAALGVLGAWNRISRLKSGSFEIYNLGNDSLVPLQRAIELLARELSVVPKLDVREAEAGDVRFTRADISKARKNLGYDPQISLEEGLSFFADWLKTQA
jgi:UDP-glucuronate 4-epimerase